MAASRQAESSWGVWLEDCSCSRSDIPHAVQVLDFHFSLRPLSYIAVVAVITRTHPMNAASSQNLWFVICYLFLMYSGSAQWTALLHFYYQFINSWFIPSVKKKKKSKKIHSYLLSKPLCCTLLEACCLFLLLFCFVLFGFVLITQLTVEMYHKHTTIIFRILQSYHESQSIFHLGRHIPTSFPRGFAAAKRELFCGSPC